MKSMVNRQILLGITLFCLVFSVASCAKKELDPLPLEIIKKEIPQSNEQWDVPAVVVHEPSGPSEDEIRSHQLAKAKEELVLPIYFGYDSSALTTASRDNLATKAGILKRYPELTMVIEGHCDERGTVEYNLALGERRARVAYDYLVILGVPVEKLSMVSFGEENPAMSGETEEAWAKNRRDEFTLFE